MMALRTSSLNSLRPCRRVNFNQLRFSSQDAAVEKGDLSVPKLSRPLGVREYPTIIPKTRMETIQSFMDQETRMEHRRHLIKEASKGYFNDLNATRRNGGKTWLAPSVMIREDKSLYFPNVSGITLDESEKRDTAILCSGRVSVIAMLSTAISEIHAKGFVERTLERFHSHPSFQYIQINLQENVLKSLLVKVFTSSLRRTVPPEQQSNYLISTQNMEYVREPLGMTNSKIGYVYLVDEALKVRWGGCADATAEEAQALLSCTGVLLNRLDKKFDGPSKDPETPDPVVEQS